MIWDFWKQQWNRKKNQFPTFIDVESAEGDISKVSPFVLQNKE